MKSSFAVVALVLAACSDGGLPDSLSPLDPVGCGWYDAGPTDAAPAGWCAMIVSTAAMLTPDAAGISACDAPGLGQACMILASGERGRAWRRVGEAEGNISTTRATQNADGSCPIACD